MTTTILRHAHLGLAAALFVAASGCATETDDEVAPEASADALRSTPLADSDMRPYPAPAGLPRPWIQPETTGLFGEGGKCGQTATANLLGLYGVSVAPEDLDARGVWSYIGTRATPIRNYLSEHHADLGCTIEHPDDGPSFLRSQLGSGHPVMVWFNTDAFLTSHWVTAVGTTQSPAGELVIVESWGRFYSIPMSTLDEAWRNVYGLQRPSIVCSRRSRYLPARL